MVQSDADAAITSSDDALTILASDGAGCAVPLGALAQAKRGARLACAVADGR